MNDDIFHTGGQNYNRYSVKLLKKQNKTKNKKKKKEKQVIDRNPILRPLLVSNANLHYCRTFEQMLVQQAS